MRERVNIVSKKDLTISWFSGTGGGGQHRNKHRNCCRMHHAASGVTATGQSHKDRPSNQNEAWRNLLVNPIFKAWVNQTAAKLNGLPTPEESVEEMMVEKNLRVEVRDESGKWVDSPT